MWDERGRCVAPQTVQLTQRGPEDRPALPTNHPTIPPIQHPPAPALLSSGCGVGTKHNIQRKGRAEMWGVGWGRRGSQGRGKRRGEKKRREQRSEMSTVFLIGIFQNTELHFLVFASNHIGYLFTRASSVYRWGQDMTSDAYSTRLKLSSLPFSTGVSFLCPFLSYKDNSFGRRSHPLTCYIWQVEAI